MKLEKFLQDNYNYNPENRGIKAIRSFIIILFIMAKIEYRKSDIQ